MVDVLKCGMKDYEKIFESYEKFQKNTIFISKVVKIIYFPNGKIDLFYRYDAKPTTIKLTSSVNVDLSKALLAGAIGVTKEKDYEHLLQSCSSTGQDFGQKFSNKTIEKTRITNKKEKVDTDVKKEPINSKKV